MKLTIAYLYYDLLNLYGDSGNFKALLYHLKEQNIKINIKYLSLYDKKEIDSYDVIYIGSGTENSLLLALNDLLKYKNELKKYINDKKFLISTGNSIELFGKKINIDNKYYNALNILNFSIEYQNKRIVKDINYKCNILDTNIIGFENHFGKIISNEKYLFENEGVTKNNFYGTYIIGPLLIRNPKFCNYLIRKIIKEKNDNFKFLKSNYKLEKLAFEINEKSIA